MKEAESRGDDSAASPRAGTSAPTTSVNPAAEERLKPAASTLAQLDLPETLRYRIKNRLLGPPIATDRQSTERLGKPTALAVLSSDVISSSAYATEQMLIPLIPIIGVAAFSLVIPISIAVIFVLLFVTLSYLEVVKVYTKAGGAYVVARENFAGLNVAQVAAMGSPHRLHVDRRSVGGGGGGRRHLRHPEPDSVYDLDRHKPGHSSRLREPARNPRSWPHIRRPHLFLHCQ